ncbi:MAG: hypothetical protein II672_02470, partial [Oscillospiraceae bacterium]|nr:hypothetical protein [Oscillospiraceae bacterium]
MKRRWLLMIPVIVFCIMSVAFVAILGKRLKATEAQKTALESEIRDLQAELEKPSDVEQIMAQYEGKALDNGEVYYSRESLKEKARDAMSLTELMA